MSPFWSKLVVSTFSYYFRKNDLLLNIENLCYFWVKILGRPRQGHLTCACVLLREPKASSWLIHLATYTVLGGKYSVLVPGPNEREAGESGFRHQRLSALSILVYLSNKMASLPFMGHWSYDRYFMLSMCVPWTPWLCSDLYYTDEAQAA